MYEERNCLLASEKTSSPAVAGVIMAIIYTGLAAGAWTFIFGELQEGSMMDADYEMFLTIAGIIVICALVGLWYFAWCQINVCRAELLFFANHLQCKVCLYNSFLGAYGGVSALNIQYGQIESVQQKNRKNLIFSVSGRRYIVAANNVPQCIQMISEMKMRNMQNYRNGYFPSRYFPS